MSMREPAWQCTFVLHNAVTGGDDIRRRSSSLASVGLRNNKVAVPASMRLTLCDLFRVSLSAASPNPPAHLHGRCRVGPKLSDKLSAQHPVRRRLQMV